MNGRQHGAAVTDSGLLFEPFRRCGDAEQCGFCLPVPWDQAPRPAGRPWKDCYRVWRDRAMAFVPADLHGEKPWP